MIFFPKAKLSTGQRKLCMGAVVPNGKWINGTSYFSKAWLLFLSSRFPLSNASADMIFVKNFTPPDFQAKTFTPSISPNFNNFSHNNTKK